MTTPVPAGEPTRSGRYAGLHPLLLAAYAVLTDVTARLPSLR